MAINYVVHPEAADRLLQNSTTHDVDLGMHIADLRTDALSGEGHVEFTFYWPDAGHWEETNFIVRIGSEAEIWKSYKHNDTV